MNLRITKTLFLTMVTTLSAKSYSGFDISGKASLYQCEALYIEKDFNTPGFYRRIPAGALLATPFVAIYSNNSNGGAIIYTYASRGWGQSPVDCTLVTNGFCISRNYSDLRFLRSSVSINAFDAVSGEPSEANVISIETRSDWGFYAAGQFQPGLQQKKYYESNCHLIKTGLTEKEVDKVLNGTQTDVTDWQVNNPPAYVEDTIPRLY